MKPLREHYTQPTDQGDMLNVFDYIEALEKHIEELKEKVKKLEFMIENSLGWEDMKNDISMPHEL
jgi:hypothetical protein